MRHAPVCLLIALFGVLAGCPSQDEQPAAQPAGGSGSTSTNSTGGGDDFEGPLPPTTDPNEPNQPTDAVDTVTLNVNVFFTDTGAPAADALVTIRSLLPFEQLCSLTTGVAGSVICETIPIGRALTISATSVDDFGETFTGQTQFTPLAGFGPRRTVVVRIFR